MSSVLFLNEKQKYNRFLDCASSEIPRSYEWCVRNAYNPLAEVDYLSSSPHSRNPLAWLDNLRKIAGCDGTVFCVGGSLLALASKRLGLLKGRLVVLVWSLPRPGLMKEVVFRHQLEAAAKIAVNDSGTGRQLSDKWPDLGSKIVFVPFPVDTAFFRPPAVRSGEFVLVPGDKDRDEELVLLLADVLEVPVVRVTREPKVRSFYESREYNRQRLIVKCRVSFRALRELYQRARMVVLPVINKRHPAGLTALLEAMACGCPCLVANGKTTADYVEHEKTAIFLEGNRKQMVDQIQEALGRPDELEDMGRRGCRHAVSNFSVDHVVPRWAQLIG